MYKNSFSIDGENIWLNCAHQGPLPKVSQESANEAIKLKRYPYLIQDSLFSQVPLKLKNEISKLINAPVDEIILGNSASYSMHLLANGIPLSKSDEVLLFKNDFPTNITPWLDLEKSKGIRITYFEPEFEHILPEEIEEQTTSKTKIICCSWVNSFNGHVLDIAELGSFCRDRGILFAVNGSQAIGYLPLDVQNFKIDALITCGFKWLCGPYGTGFSWFSKDLLEQINYNQNYWLNHISEELSEEGSFTNYTGELKKDGSKYDVFGTANFLNFMPWTKSIELINSFGQEEIKNYNFELIDLLNKRLTKELNGIKIISPIKPENYSSLFVFQIEGQSSKKIYQGLKDRNIHISLRNGYLRVSPHLYNTSNEIETLVEKLNLLTSG